MGTWGTKSFENDTAGDWLLDVECRALEEISKSILLDIDIVLDFLLKTHETDIAIDSELGSEAVAALELLCCLKKDPLAKAELSPELANLLDISAEHMVTVPPEAISKAKQVLDIIENPQSELFELWQESPNFTKWQEAMCDLRARLIN